MSNPNFSPEYSTNSIWVDEDQEVCLTDYLDGMETNIESLQTGKANTNHTHAEYAPLEHEHVQYALTNHTHVGYATEEYVGTHIEGKVDKVDGKELSSNDYTDTEKAKLAGIATGANKYTLPTAGANLGGVKTTSTVSSNSGYTACPIIEGVPYYKDTNTTYSALKNPNELTLQFNGSTNKAYDGSSAQTFNVTPDAIGISDYVVETGISGNLTYRKWSSGIAEAWYNEVLRNLPLTSEMTTGVWSNSSYNNRSVNFPSGLFVDIPMAVGNIYGTAYLHLQVSSAIKSKMVYRIWCPYSTNASGGYVSIYVIGRWKS